MITRVKHVHKTFLFLFIDFYFSSKRLKQISLMFYFASRTMRCCRIWGTRRARWWCHPGAGWCLCGPFGCALPVPRDTWTGSGSTLIRMFYSPKYSYFSLLEFSRKLWHFKNLVLFRKKLSQRKTNCNKFY